MCFELGYTSRLIIQRKLTWAVIDTSRQAVEPVFSLSPHCPFQNLHTILRIVFQDSALSNALLMTLTFAAGGETLTAECLAYKSQAIQSINQKMANVVEAASMGTIASILLLVGIEVGSTSCAAKGSKEKGLTLRH
jgi:hypothetical protein